MRRWICKAFRPSVWLLLSLIAVHPLGADEVADLFATVEDLGDGLYRVGFIEVDANLQRLTVPGRIDLGDQPLKSFAVAGAGFKGFESLVELDANAYQFNAACTLLGMTPGSGDLVDIRVSWEIDGTTTTLDAADLVWHGQNPLSADGWAYTGSQYTPDGELQAHHDGTLIGIVEDPVSVIQHAGSLAADDPDPLAPNLSSLPPAGTRITLTVER